MSLTSRLNALIENEVATQQRKIDLIQAETERIIASTKKKIEANASLVYLDLLNEALNESVKYKALDMQTALDVKRIESEVLKLRATKMIRRRPELCSCSIVSRYKYRTQFMMLKH